MISSVGRATVASALVLIGGAASLAAQNPWRASGSSGSVTLELLRPSLKTSYVDQSLASGALFLSGRVPISSTTFFVAELPAAYGSFTSTGFGSTVTASSAMVGNPYVGIEGGRDGARFFGEFGVRVPIASENQPEAILVGTLADLERMDVFLPKVVSVSALANLRSTTPEGFLLRVRVGPVAWIPTEGSGTVELLGAYALQVGYEARSLSLIAGLGGRAIITEDVDNRFMDHFVVAASYRIGVLRPGLSLRLPIDNYYRDAVGSVLGLSLGIELP